MSDPKGGEKGGKKGKKGRTRTSPGLRLCYEPPTRGKKGEEIKALGVRDSRKRNSSGKKIKGGEKGSCPPTALHYLLYYIQPYLLY